MCGYYSNVKYKQYSEDMVTEMVYVSLARASDANVINIYRIHRKYDYP